MWQLVGVQAVVVLNAVPVQGQLAAQAQKAMTDQGVAVAPVMVCQRVAHVHAFTAGLTAQEREPRSQGRRGAGGAVRVGGGPKGDRMSKTDDDLSAALSRAAGGSASRAKRSAAPRDRKALLLRLDPAVVKRLKLLAVERDTTVQQLGEEAIDRLLKRYEN